MTKEQQLEINDSALELWHHAIVEYRKQLRTVKKHKLRHCDAKVYETDNYFILQSFETLVAAIEKTTNEATDVLRYVYGFTRCSTRQISYFLNDFTPFPHNYLCFRWKKV